MTLKILRSGKTMKLLSWLNGHVSHLVVCLGFFFLIWLRNRESYEIPPDFKIRGTQTSGNIHENFEKESTAMEKVIQWF